MLGPAIEFASATRVLKALFLLLVVLCAAIPAVAQPSLIVKVESGPTSALLNQELTCDPIDIPDTPARALRLKNGSVQLYATNRDNRVDSGPDLLHLEHRCPVVYRGRGEADPAAYDDRAWIASLWTPDGQTIWAVVHNEYHGELRPVLCPTRRYMDCWFNSLTLAVSHDGGAHYDRAPGNALVATLPYRFDQLGLGHHGYFNPSNIVSFDGYHYMFAFATGANAQKNGNCLLRTKAVGQASAWNGWDGVAFSIKFINPYAGLAEPEEHVCAPVRVGQLRWPVTSLVRHAPSGTFIALMQDTSPGGGVFYSTSADLLNWSKPYLLMPAVGLSNWLCGNPSPIVFPSILDPSSDDLNFETVSAHALLFATEFEVKDCKLASRRLVRWKITIQPTQTVSDKHP